MINRRKFLSKSALGATAFLLPHYLLKGEVITQADAHTLRHSFDAPTYKALADFALQLAKSNGASYADIRINSQIQERITAIQKSKAQSAYAYSRGFSVRVVVSGCMSFVAHEGVPTQAIVEQLVLKAMTMAKSSAALKITGVKMAPQEALHHVSWKTPVSKNVFEVPLEEKQQLLQEVNTAALTSGADYVESMLFAQLEQKYLATTDGSYIEQEVHHFWPTFIVQAKDAVTDNSQYRSALSSPVAKGYEYLQKNPTDKINGTVVRYKTNYDMLEDVKAAAQQVKQKLTAKSIEPGQYDLIIDPTALGSVIHHTIGKALNLDFIAGDDMATNASSFIDLAKWKAGDKTIANRYVNFMADRIQAGSLATIGYDDEGIKTKQWPVVKEGVIESFFMERTKNQLVDENRSNGCGGSSSWQFPVRCQMPNVSLAPGKAPLTVEELISQVKKGIWVVGAGRCSIDQQHSNFQMTGNLCYEIENGEIKGMLKDVAFHSTTKDFWNACSQICDRRDYRTVGVIATTKEQRLAASHGSTTSRFNGIQVTRTSSNQ